MSDICVSHPDMSEGAQHRSARVANEQSYAWNHCRSNRRLWLQSDPLDFDLTEIALTANDASVRLGNRSVQIDFQTKPKQHGGVRLEVLPDIITSTFLQIAADKLTSLVLPLSNSLSAQLFETRLKGDDPYAACSVPISQWVRKELATGRCVIAVDIRNYFGSISDSQIAHAIYSSGLDDKTSREAIRLIDAINAAPDFDGNTRSGLPVVPEDFFWLLAELVLVPIDDALKRNPQIEQFTRWVDDFYVSLDTAHMQSVLDQITSLLRQHGFELNNSKTKIYRSIPQYDQEMKNAEHDVLDDLFLIELQGTISDGQQLAFDALVERANQTARDDSRLWKRIYTFATRIRSNTLIGQACADLKRLPSAAQQILAYMGSQCRFQRDLAGLLISVANESTTDSAAIISLRTLLLFPPQEIRRWNAALRHLIYRSDSGLHPFCKVLAFACLVKQGAETIIDARKLLSLAQTWNAPIATQVSIELLLLVPQIRSELERILRVSTAEEALAIQRFIFYPSDPNNWASVGRLSQPLPPREDNWAGLGIQIRRILGLSRSLSADFIGS